jgi:hypothetical protein
MPPSLTTSYVSSPGGQAARMPEPGAPCLPGRRAQNVEARDRQICIEVGVFLAPG